MKNHKAFRVLLVLLVIVAMTSLAPLVSADSSYQSLPFTQAWTNTGLITVTDDWSGVPGIVGYRGDDLTTTTGTDPQTILADGTSTPVNVLANQSNPNTLSTGGVAEFDVIADPVVAFQGSGTADAPFLLVHVNTTGKQSITVSYNLRDIDGSTDNAIQPVALQYRVGTSGNFTNLPAGYVADATTGPSLATLVTPVNVTLPSAADNQAQVQIRIITTNAAGSDEWVGVDDILVTGAPLAAVLADFSAAPNGNAIRVTWETVSEVGNIGFNLWRGDSPSAPDTQLNSALIPSQGPGSSQGFVYTFDDANVVNGMTYYYWVETVDTQGGVSRFGPVSATFNAPTAVSLSGFAPVAALPAAWPLAAAGLAALAGAAAWRRRR